MSVCHILQRPLVAGRNHHGGRMVKKRESEWLHSERTSPLMTGCDERSCGKVVMEVWDQEEKGKRMTRIREDVTFDHWRSFFLLDPRTSSIGMFCSKKKLLPPCPNILTPEKIPTFFIPPQLSALPDGGGHVGRWLQKKPSDMRSSPRAVVRSASRRVIQMEDVEPEGQTQQQAMAASLLGSPYLSESPHTRRRESLFHQMCHTRGPCDLKPLSPLDPDHILNWKSSSRDLRLQRFSCGVLESDTASSTESSPLLNRSLKGRPDPSSYCRTVNALTRANSLSTEEASSTDSSPNLPTKENHGRTSMMHLVPPPIFQLDFICCQERLTKETEVALSKGGLLRLSVEYVKDLGHLRVKLVNAESLYPLYQDPRGISCCVAIYLMPGKLQKQRSTVIRRSRNPIFNEDFYFEGVGKGELDNLRLRVKVINRGTGMKLDRVLGSGELRLSTIIPL